MDLTAVIASLLRRWYVVVAGVLVAAGLVSVALTLVPPSYSASGSMLLLPSSDDVKDGSNPLLQLGGLEQPASLAVAYLSGNDVQAEFAANFPGAEFTVEVDPLSRGPLIVFSTEAPSADEATSSLQGAVALLPEALTTLQDSVEAPNDARVRAVPLAVDEHATIVKGQTLRAAILAGGLGLGLAFAGAVAVDSLLARRVTRRSSGRRPLPRNSRVAERTPAATERVLDDQPTVQWAQTSTTAPRR